MERRVSAYFMAILRPLSNITKARNIVVAAVPIRRMLSTC
jgi:hypothetical protein